MTTETDVQPDDAGQIPAPEVQDQTPPTEAAPAEPAPAAQDPQPEPEPKREPWFQKRIDKLTHDKRELERQLQAAQDLLQRGPEPQRDPNQPLTEAEVERRAAAKAQELAAKQAQEAKANAFNQRCNDVYEAGKKEFSDFPEAVAQLNSAGVVNQEFLDSVLETEAPAKVLHHLGSNPEEAMRIAALPPKKQAIELDRLAAKMSAPAPKAVSKAPPPPNPITGGAKAAFDPASPDADIREWMKWREKELATKGRR